MRLVINDPDELVSYRFCNWLISQIQLKYKETVIVRKFSGVDAYMETLDFMANHSGDTSFSIMNRGVANLVVKIYKNRYVIQIDDSLMYDFQSQTKLISMCKLINYGTASVRGYPIMQEIFSYYANNLPALLKYFYLYVDRR